MKLIRLTLAGTYKSLSDQSFDFDQSSGNIIALIGLNGSGKSQLIELISEVFAYLERQSRDDFRTREPLGFGVTIIYGIHPYLDLAEYQICKAIIKQNGTIQVFSRRRRDSEWMESTINDAHLPQHIIGYSSGLNENLQRSFLKNAVQYYDVMSVRANRRKRLTEDIDDEQYRDINEFYLKRYPGIFKTGDFSNEFSNEYRTIKEKDTKIPASIFMDYDCTSLLMASLAILPSKTLDDLFPAIQYRYPQKFSLQYDLRKVVIEEDTIQDIKQIIKLAGKNAVTGNCKKTSDEEYDLYEIDYLAATIDIDFSKTGLIDQFRERYYNFPIRFFERLYKIQILGIKNCQTKDKRNLRKDSFFGNVKKPLKTKLPLEITNLKLSNGRNLINFDDLSDGETQLIQTLGATQIFSQDNTLFLFDEPETHLNPSWRTSYHKYLSKSVESNGGSEKRVQIFLSTHSPFLLSSLRKENVFLFEQNDININMTQVSSNTYGAAFDVLIKQFFGLKSLISQTAVEEIRQHLHKKDLSKEKQKEWIENNVGDSMEKAYLLRRLKD